MQTLVAEWIPFGSNQIVGLNERLGALDRCQGGFFTSMVDDSPTDTKMTVPQGNTNVKILDFDFVRFINFEADINYAEDVYKLTGANPYHGRRAKHHHTS